MDKSYKTVYESGTGEIVEKKSRFIASVWPIQTEEEALNIIDQLRKKYWDAKHNCFAYVLGIKDEIQRCSDDGEPAKTAGKPMLDILLGEEIHNALIVVTRYFGGTLLGTGGLVRAYQYAAKEGLHHSLIINKLYGSKLELITDYNGIGKINYLISQSGFEILQSEYSDNVKLTVLVPENDIEEFTTSVTEVTNGKATLCELNKTYYSNMAGKILLFEN
jgi:uncharacterized YigZ family protein